ncbi:MAG: hypothetical protein Q4D89_02905 [Arachnia propionica]|uniref:hypothetical protein n=1 Tax=Arachnia propionica TaxID=1750 RepID=UPI00270553DE|nr:hypothetical protein [Arachnia propionica]
MSHTHLSRRSFGLLGLTAAALGGTAHLAHADEPTPDARLVPATGHRLDSAEFARLYGPGTFTITSLANMVIGIPSKNGKPVNHEYIAVYRFRSLIEGKLDKVRLYWPTGTDYANGNGGRIRVRVLPDDGSNDHLPNLTATAVAEFVHTPNLTPGEKKSILDEMSFTTSSTALVKGELYHMVFDNLDPDPAANFISVDTQSTPAEAGRPARWLNTTDWSALMGTRRKGTRGAYTWTNLTETGSGGKLFSPIMQLTTVDGATQGVSDVESQSVVGRTDNTPDFRVYKVSTGRPVRELFTPGVDKKVTGLSFATVATVGGSLRWRITEGGKELAAGRITQAQPNYKYFTLGKSRLSNFVWYDAALPGELTFRAGTSYGVEFHAEGASQWYFCGHRNGSGNGFTWPAAFTESNAQHQVGGLWVNTNPRDLTKPRKDTNWPVVLHLAP